MCSSDLPFKKSVIPFLDQLTPLAKEVQSVNTIFKKDDKIIGDNTDIGGFEKSLKYINYDLKNKNVFILGAGGVVPSIILALKRLGAAKIILSNRTKKKANYLKKKYTDLDAASGRLREYVTARCGEPGSVLFDLMAGAIGSPLDT